MSFMEIIKFFQKEWGVIWRAPVIFLLALTAIAVWWAAGLVYQHEISGVKAETASAKAETASAKQETATAIQQRDLFKARLELVVAAAPAPAQSSTSPTVAPTEKKTPIVVQRHKDPESPVVTSSIPLPPDPTGNNVTSYYQSGGITAGTVNVGVQPRVLRDQDKRALLNNLQKDKPIAVTALMGDGEAISLATDIYAFLKANGFRMADSGINQGLFNKPVNGVQISLGGPKVSIIVGANLPQNAQ